MNSKLVLRDAKHRDDYHRLLNRLVEVFLNGGGEVIRGRLIACEPFTLTIVNNGETVIVNKGFIAFVKEAR